MIVSNVLPLDISFDKTTRDWSAKWSGDVDGTGWSGNARMGCAWLSAGRPCGRP